MGALACYAGSAFDGYCHTGQYRLVVESQDPTVSGASAIVFEGTLCDFGQIEGTCL